MASYDPIEPHERPLRFTTPVARRGYLWILAGLLVASAVAYLVPYLAFQTGYAYESGRARAASEMLAKLDEAGIIGRASALFRAASRAVGPAVVNIQCDRDINFAQGVALPPGIPRRGLLPVSAGSGVVIDKANGYIVTNGHVVDGADAIRVRVDGGAEYSARLVGADAKTDLAVLKVDAPLLVEAQWGSIDTLDIGDWVLAIGSPFQLEQSVTAGIVSAVGRRNLRIVGEGGGYEDFIQTDAAINPGNSGGPLIDLRGKVVGINTAIYSPRGPEVEGGGGNVGIGFAISAELARNVVEQIIKNGRVSRGYLGVVLDPLTPALARRLGLPDSQGALVGEVDPDSPAARAGLVTGDVIVSLDQEPIHGPGDLRVRTAIAQTGSSVAITVLREGRPVELTARIAELPILRALGLRLAEVEPESPGEPSTLIIDQILRGSPADRAGLHEGMQVLAVANRPVLSRDEANEQASRLESGQGVPLTIRDRGRVREVLLGAPPVRSREAGPER